MHAIKKKYFMSSAKLILAITILWLVLSFDSFIATLFLLVIIGIWKTLDSEKVKKGSGSMVQGQVFLKGGGWHFSLFNIVKVYHF